MASVPPALGRTSGSFRHSERYAATAVRYSRALERERNAEEIARDGASGSERSLSETELLLGEPGYLDRERRKNDSFRQGCGRACVAVFVLAAFAAVAVIGFQHFREDNFSKHKADAVAVDPSSTTTRSSSASRATTVERKSAEVSAWSTSAEKAGNSSRTHPPPPPPPPMSEEVFEEVAADEAADLVADAMKHSRGTSGGLTAALLGRKRERIGHKFKPLSNTTVTPDTGDGEPDTVPISLPEDPTNPKDPKEPIKLPAEGVARSGQ